VGNGTALSLSGGGLVVDSTMRYYHRRQRQNIDTMTRPGRAGKAMVGHVFLSRAALTKTNPYFDCLLQIDDAGDATVSSYAHYGVSTYGDDDVYAEEY